MLYLVIVWHIRLSTLSGEMMTRHRGHGLHSVTHGLFSPRFFAWCMNVNGISHLKESQLSLSFASPIILPQLNSSVSLTGNDVSAVDHWFCCGATEPGFAGDIGAIEVWLIDWLKVFYYFNSYGTVSSILLLTTDLPVAPLSLASPGILAL